METEAASELSALTAYQAADLAGITYRRLDHWARRGWVTPTVDQGLGRAGKRLYSPADVVRLAALHHFSEAGWSVAQVGEQMARADIDVSDASYLVFGTTSGLVACDTDAALLECMSSEQKFTVFDVQGFKVSFAQ